MGMKLLLVDDHTMFRDGLRLLLPALRPDVLVEVAATLNDAVTRCHLDDFRVVLLDLGLADSKGPETLIRFREGAPHVPVVVLSGDESPQHMRACIDAGALGYLPKTLDADGMIKALRFILDGGIYVPAAALQQVTTEGPRFPQAFSRLSVRQKEVAQLMLQGLAYKVIADRLRVSEGTVKAHVSAVLQILGVRSRVEAVLYAARDGVFDDDDQRCAQG
jgi:two-component system, NarL family, nitrate/nitrite response regulator NarL